jgi:prepilin-type N-terminal cleavage/methylation domain-containing protein
MNAGSSQNHGWYRQRGITSMQAFTLVELLTVIAILAILAGIVLPATLGAGATAQRAQIRIRFQQWASAIEDFRQQYGAYPIFHEDGKLNGGATADPGGAHIFHDTLSGRRRDGSPLPDPVPGLPGDRSKSRAGCFETDLTNLSARCRESSAGGPPGSFRPIPPGS